MSPFLYLSNFSSIYCNFKFNMIYYGRVKPPTPDMQERIVELLRLTDSEKTELYSKAAVGRNELPKDIVEYLTNNQAEIENLRERMRA